MPRLDSVLEDPARAWAPWEPTADEPWDARRAAHLGRRAAFGVSSAQLDAMLSREPAQCVDAWLADDRDDAFAAQLRALAAPALATGDPAALEPWWLHRLLHTPVPLHEQLTLMWHNHFATSAAKVRSARLMLQQNELLRRHARGDFAALVQAMSRDPAMLIYLDSTANRRLHPNENYARELMELFCLGEGHYDERDVQEAARCFTGWEVRRDAFYFNAREHDAGTKTLFGEAGAFDGDEAVERILRRPAAPRHVAARLVSHFVTDERLPPETLQPLADSLREHDFQLAPVVAKVLGSRAFFASWCVGRRVRSPLDLAVGLLRALEGSTSATALADALRPLGQRPFFPPSVKGWPGGRAWINATTMLGRVNLAARLLGHESTRFGGDSLAVYVERQGAVSPADVVDWLAARLLAEELPPDARQALVALASVGPAEQCATRALGGLAALPQFQLC